MPVGQKLDPIDVTFIKIWIKMGAKNSSNCSNCDTTNYTYSGRVNPLINLWCVGCHNSSNTGEVLIYRVIVASLLQLLAIN